MNLLVPQYAYRLKNNFQQEQQALHKDNQQQNAYFSNRLQKQVVVSASLSPSRNASRTQENVQIIKQAKHINNQQDKDEIEGGISTSKRVAMNHTVKKKGKAMNFNEENYQNASAQSNQSTYHHQQQSEGEDNSLECNIPEVLMHQNKDITDKVLILTKETQRIRIELSKEKEEKNMLYKRIDSLLAEKTMLESKLSFSQERETEKKREFQSIEKQKKELAARVNELMGKIQEQQLTIEQQSQIQNETETKVEELISENARVIQLFENMSSDNLATLEQQLAREKQAEKRNQQQEAEIKDLQRIVAKIEKERDENAQKLKETEIERLGQEIRAERMIVEVMEITEQKDNIEKLSIEQKQQMENGIEELVKSVNNLNNKLENAVAEKIRVEEEIAVLRQSYLEVRQEIILIEEDRKQEIDLRKQIEGQLRELQSGLESIEQKYSKNKEIMVLMECKMKEYEDQSRKEGQLINELTEELKQSGGIIQQLKEEKVEREQVLLKEKQNEINKLTIKLKEQHQRQLDELSQNKENIQSVLQNQIDLLITDKDEISKQYVESKGQVQSMQEELNSRATQISQLISANQQLRSMVDQHKQTHQNQIQEMKIHLQHIQTDKDVAEQAKNDLQIQLDSSIKKNQTILDLNDQLNNQGTQTTLRQQLQLSRQENEQNIQKKDEEIKQLKETIKNNTVEQTLLKEEIDIKKKLLINLQKENSQFRKQICFALPAEERTQKLLETQSEQNAELMKKLKENEKISLQYKDKVEELQERYTLISRENQEMKQILESSNDTARTFNQLNVLSQANQKLAEENTQLYDLLKLRENECNFLQRNLNAVSQKRQ